MQLVQRTLDALSILSRAKEGLSVSELSEGLSIPMSSAHRLLACFKKNNFVSQDERSRRYRIGYKLLTLTSHIKQESELINSVRPYIKELSDSLSRTVALCVLEGEHIVCIDFVENKDISLFYVRTGFAMPAHSTSAGKVIQAYLPQSKLNLYLERTVFDAVTPNTITNKDDYIYELSRIRDRGFSICDEELQTGVQGYACPVFDCFGNVIASISFNVLKTAGIDLEPEISMLKDCSKKISESLG